MASGNKTGAAQTTGAGAGDTKHTQVGKVPGTPCRAPKSEIDEMIIQKWGQKTVIDRPGVASFDRSPRPPGVCAAPPAALNRMAPNRMAPTVTDTRNANRWRATKPPTKFNTMCVCNLSWLHVLSEHSPKLLGGDGKRRTSGEASDLCPRLLSLQGVGLRLQLFRCEKALHKATL